ncbi:MAG: hypothetical protein HYZ62_00775 [Candidatus Andersenbacteria bacterium]|nr:hypothetical protein [Candidatus Andersenbacteria bacterium]
MHGLGIGQVRRFIGRHIGVLKIHSLVVCLYIILAMGMSWPILANVGSSVVGVGGDPWQTMWRFESKYAALAKAFDDKHVADFVKQEFLGGGEARLVNISVWPWMWAYQLFGMPAAYNFIWLLGFVLSGYAMFLFVHYLAAGRIHGKEVWLQLAPAFLTGVFYMFLPFRVAHAQGHFGAMQTQWLPFILLVFVALYRKFSWWKLFLLWLLFTIQAWSEHHYALWLGVMALVYALLERQRLRVFIAQKRHALAGGVLAVLLLVSVGLAYVPTLRLSALGDSLELGQEQTIRFSADLFSFVVPAPLHSLWGSTFNRLFAHYFTGNAAEATQFLGWVPALLILFFRAHIPRRQRRVWFVIGIVFFVITLGPRLHVFGRVLPWPMPYALIDNWPLFSAVRAVARAGVVVCLAAAILLFWVLKKNIHRGASAVLFGFLLLLEFSFMPSALQSAALSPVYSYLRPDSGSAVIEIPAATNYTAASRALYAGLRSGKRVIGNIALERAGVADDGELVKSVPAIRQLLYLRTTDLRRDRSEFFAQSLPESLPDALAFLDVGEIIVHTDSLTPLQLSAIRGFLEEDVGMSAIEVDDALFYAVPQVFSRPHDFVFLMRDSRWTGVSLDQKRGHVYGEIEHRAAITLVNVSERTQPMRIKLTLAPESPGGLKIWRSGQEIGEIRPGGVGVYPVAALPGKTVIDFERVGQSKAVIQDPQLLYGQ